MPKINIKPMSVNVAWQGKRFKTKEYKAYELVLMHKLPKLPIMHGKLHIKFIFGISKLSDIDNPLKPLIDILQKKYKFNDKNVMKLEVDKVIVKNGKEFFDFEILQYEI